jgi:hypothetical protein
MKKEDKMVVTGGIGVAVFIALTVLCAAFGVITGAVLFVLGAGATAFIAGHLGLLNE